MHRQARNVGSLPELAVYLKDPRKSTSMVPEVKDEFGETMGHTLKPQTVFGEWGFHSQHHLKADLIQ